MLLFIYAFTGACSRFLLKPCFFSYVIAVFIRVQTAEKHLSPLRMASDLLREAGLAGFYRGVASPVAGAALITSSVFGGYGLFQSIVRGVRGKGDGG